MLIDVQQLIPINDSNVCEYEIFPFIDTRSIVIQTSYAKDINNDILLSNYFI